MNTSPKRHSLSLLTASAAILMLGACGTAGPASQTQSKASQIDTALYNAAQKSSGQKSLALLEKIYKRNSRSETAAIDYARGLRWADYNNRAAIVLAPFATAADTSGSAQREYAAIQLALGNYRDAESFAQKAILQDETDFKAYEYLGIALDARSLHTEAERAFRKAMEIWQGDPTPVMNNLALNLTTQGRPNEAADLLEEALVIAPGRREIQRNLRIIRALQQSHAPRTPKPVAKPDKKEKT